MIEIVENKIRKAPHAKIVLSLWPFRNEKGFGPWLQTVWPKIVTFLVFLSVWQVLAAWGILNTKILPPPTQLIVTVQEMFASGELWTHSIFSVQRVLVGFFTAAIIGVAAGLILGATNRLSLYLTPLIELLRPIPPIAWIPLAILWFGIGDRPSYFIVALGAFFPIFINTFKGIRSVHPSHILAARCLGADRRLLLTDILIPSALPYILTGLRIGIGIAWTSVIAAELVGAQSGLGYMIQLNRILLQTDKIVVGMISIGVIGMAMNQGMVLLERRWLVWEEAYDE